jgi:hypothetical protein
MAVIFLQIAVGIYLGIYELNEFSGVKHPFSDRGL